MTDHTSNNQTRTHALQNEETRKRWDLFHRAIAHAKQANNTGLGADNEQARLKPVSLDPTGS